jgi:hypothetical protein
MSPADAFGSPILTSEWNASTDLLRKLPKQSAEPLAAPKILKLATRHLACQPTSNLFLPGFHASSPRGSSENKPLFSPNAKRSNS